MSVPTLRRSKPRQRDSGRIAAIGARPGRIRRHIAITGCLIGQGD